MADRETFVYVDLEGTPHLAGRLWTRVSHGRESASFEYDQEWLRNPLKFALEPALSLGLGSFHTRQGKALFGALGDSSPDRWGRNLINRAERRRARAAGQSPRTVLEVDYLLGVSDETRLGALRFSETEDGEFMASTVERPVPPLIALPDLLRASANVEADSDSSEDLQLLLAPGSSLGGARPKASVRGKTGELLIAKFPSQTDDHDLVRWETVALTLAGRAGIPVPGYRLEAVADRHVIVLERFDRRSSGRIPMLSAMSLLGADEGEAGSYVEIGDSLRQHGSAVSVDLPQLWRRMVFNILISNLDDHLRNHALLYEDQRGWRLSPAYDLNPVPADIKPRILATAISVDRDPTASLELALEAASDFDLTASKARGIAREVGLATAKWRATGTRMGFTDAQLDRMESAFEHKDLAEAIK
jgi:serine/threonine-protein kinase HipA